MPNHSISSTVLDFFQLLHSNQPFSPCFYLGGDGISQVTIYRCEHTGWSTNGGQIAQTMRLSTGGWARTQPRNRVLCYLDSMSASRSSRTSPCFTTDCSSSFLASVFWLDAAQGIEAGDPGAGEKEQRHSFPLTFTWGSGCQSHSFCQTALPRICVVLCISSLATQAWGIWLPTASSPGGLH